MVFTRRPHRRHWLWIHQGSCLREIFNVRCLNQSILPAVSKKSRNIDTWVNRRCQLNHPPSLLPPPPGTIYTNQLIYHQINKLSPSSSTTFPYINLLPPFINPLFLFTNHNWVWPTYNMYTCIAPTPSAMMFHKTCTYVNLSQIKLGYTGLKILFFNHSYLYILLGSHSV